MSRHGAADVLHMRAGALLGLRVHEAELSGTVQGKAFRSRKHRVVRASVSPVWA
jgi:hypothetical protein